MKRKNSVDFTVEKSEVVSQEIIRTGKDELNLIEHPFASMWDKEELGTVIYHEWEARHPISGKAMRASWRVAGDPEMGLPKPNDERVYLVLLELTREAHFQSQTVYFTRYDLIKRLGWSQDQKHYQMLYDAFERLKAVNITAKNAFWEPRAKSFRNIGFSIIDNYDILNEKPGRKKAEQMEIPLSYFRWNDMMFNSFQAGYIRTLDLGLALSLKGDIALRLYRYLDKKSYDGRSHFEIELTALCERHLGMRTARYASTYKARLKTAHQELVDHGILTSVAYKPMKSKKAEKVCYFFATKRPELPEEVPIVNSTETNEQKLSQSNSALLQRLLDLKISPDVARELLANTSVTALEAQLDCLPDRAPKDPAAVFVKAVREGWELPAKFLDRVKASERAQKSQMTSDAQKRNQAAQEALAAQQMALQQREAADLDEMWQKLDIQTRERIEIQVREKLENNEFFRARIQAGKLTPQSPDWMNTRHAILKEMLGKTDEKLFIS